MLKKNIIIFLIIILTFFIDLLTKNLALNHLIINYSLSINNHLLAIDIENSSNKKCERCWHKCKTVGTNKRYGNICHRCITNVYGKGEIRINA